MSIRVRIIHEGDADDREGEERWTEYTVEAIEIISYSEPIPVSIDGGTIIIGEVKP